MFINCKQDIYDKKTTNYLNLLYSFSFQKKFAWLSKYAKTQEERDEAKRVLDKDNEGYKDPKEVPVSEDDPPTLVVGYKASKRKRRSDGKSPSSKKSKKN